MFSPSINEALEPSDELEDKEGLGVGPEESWESGRLGWNEIALARKGTTSKRGSPGLSEEMSASYDTLGENPRGDELGEAHGDVSGESLGETGGDKGSVGTMLASERRVFCHLGEVGGEEGGELEGELTGLNEKGVSVKDSTLTEQGQTQ